MGVSIFLTFIIVTGVINMIDGKSLFSPSKHDFETNDAFLSDRPYAKKLIIDTDGGPDDAGALLLVISALKKKKNTNYDIIGITCVFGNTEERNVEQNILKTLTVAESFNIPVFRGAEKPKFGKFVNENYFGSDGLCDFEFNQTIHAEVDEFLDASSALVKFAKKYQGELDILVLGPLTNIALAEQEDPNFLSNVDRLFIMGGDVKNKKRGLSATFNFRNDPRSTFDILNFPNITKPYLLYPGQTDFKAAIPLDWRKYNLGAKKSRYIEFLNKAEKKNLESNGKIWRAGDIVTAAVMLWPELITEKIIKYAIPFMGPQNAGAMDIDFEDKLGKPANVEFVLNYNVTAFKALLLELL